MLKINHDAPARGKAQNFLLTTKLFCGLCGSPMIGDGGTSHTGKAYAYYSCTKRKRGRSCKKESVPKDWIEDLVVGELVKIVHNDELIEQIADRVMEYQKREKDQSGLHALEIRQKENEKAISNMLAAIEAGIITPSTKTRLMELEADRADIEKGIAHELLAEPEFERDQIIYFLERFRSGDINDEAYRIMLVDTFLNSVYLYDDDHLVLVMNYSGENCKVDLKLVEGAVSGDGCKGSAFAPSSVPDKRIEPIYYPSKIHQITGNSIFVLIVLQFVQQHISHIGFVVIRDQMNRQINTWFQKSHNNRGFQKCSTVNRDISVNSHFLQTSMI